MREFVVFDEHDREIDWIDPVVSVEEDRHYWHVDNGYTVYEVRRYAGYRYEIRERGDKE